MSFSFTANGKPKDIIREVGQQAAVNPQLPQDFADAINLQLGQLPEDAAVGLTCHGHTGWGQAQTFGKIELHVELIITAMNHPAAKPPVDE